MSDELTNMDEVRDRVSGIRTVMVTTPDEHGRLAARPMTVQKVDDGGDVWFLAGANADWLPETTTAANVAFTDDDGWLSFTGELQLVTRESVRDELWDEISATWFSDGKDDARVLRLHTDEVEWWTSPGTLRSLVSVATAKVKGDTPDAGDSGTVQA